MFTANKNNQPTSYSFYVASKDSKSNIFHNLVFMKKKGGGWIYRLLKYTPNENSKPNLFQGSIQELFDSEKKAENTSSGKVACYYQILTSLGTCSYGHKTISDCGGNVNCCANCWTVYQTAMLNCDHEGLEYPGDGGGFPINDGGGFQPGGFVSLVLALDANHRTKFYTLSEEVKLYLMQNYQSNLDIGFSNWSIDFFVQNPATTAVQFEKWFINGNLDFQNNADVEFAADLSGLSHDLLLANQNGTLNQLQTSWPNWEKVKQKIKNSIAQGVHQTAKIVKTYYDEVISNPYTNNAATRVVLNVYIDALRNEIQQTTNMNKDTMNWQNLYNIWLFELMPNPYSSINFTWNSNVINGNTLYNANTNAVYKFPKGSPDMMNDIKNGLSNGSFNVGNNMSRYFHYNFTQYYATLSNNNIGIQMLGSYPVKATVVSKSGNSAVVRFYIFNTLGWESATRFVQTGNGTIGVIPNKEIGEGIHLGGNLENTYTWEETIIF